MLYRLKPVMVKAVQFKKGARLPDWAKERSSLVTEDGGVHYLKVQTIEGTTHANDGDWILRYEESGAMNVLSAADFQRRYEKV